MASIGNVGNMTEENVRLLQAIEDKCNYGMPFERLSDEESKFLRKIKPLKDDIEYPPSALKLHWVMIIREMNYQSQRLDNEPDYELENYPKVVCFTNDIRTPENVRSDAIKLRKKFHKIIMDRVMQKCLDPEIGVEDLSVNEQLVLDRQNLNKVKLPEIVIKLHWKVAYQFLKKEMDIYQDGRLEPDEELQSKIKFFMRSDLVPRYLKELAKAFYDILPSEN